MLGAMMHARPAWAFSRRTPRKTAWSACPAACSGEGNKPRAIDTVTWHDRGTTLDGTEVDIADTGAGERAAARAVEPGQQLVIRLPSGLSYQVIRNAGCLSPVPGDIIAVEYRDKREGAGVAESDWGSWSAAGVPRGHERRRSARLPEYATNAMAGRIRQREQITAVEQGVET